MARKSSEAFRTISEVAALLDTPAHVLRFWESRFAQLNPVKRAGGRRYYRPADVALIDAIRKLLHEDGITIRGVQKILKEQGARQVAAGSALVEGDDLTALASPEAAPPPARPAPAAAHPAGPKRPKAPAANAPELPFDAPPRPAPARPAAAAPPAPVAAPAADTLPPAETFPLSVRLRALPRRVLVSRRAALLPLASRLAALHARLGPKAGDRSG